MAHVLCICAAKRPGHARPFNELMRRLFATPFSVLRFVSFVEGAVASTGKDRLVEIGRVRRFVRHSVLALLFGTFRIHPQLLSGLAAPVRPEHPLTRIHTVKQKPRAIPGVFVVRYALDRSRRRHRCLALEPPSDKSGRDKPVAQENKR